MSTNGNDVNGNGNKAVAIVTETSGLPAVITESPFFRDVFGDGHSSLQAISPSDWTDLTMVKSEVESRFTHGLELIEQAFRHPQDWYSPELQPRLIESVYAGLRLFIRPFLLEAMMGSGDAVHLITESNPGWQSLKQTLQLALGVAEKLRIEWSAGRQVNAVERAKWFEVDDLMKQRQEEFLRRLFSGLDKLTQLMAGIDFGEGGVDDFIQQVNSGQTEAFERRLNAIQSRWEKNSQDSLLNEQRARELDGKRQELDQGFADLADVRVKLEEARLVFEREVDGLNDELREIKAKNTKLSKDNTGLNDNMETLANGLDVAMTDLISLRDKVRGKSVKTLSLEELEEIIDNVPRSARQLLVEKADQ